MTIVILGLSITSSWGNGHATTYRALVRGLASRGHDVLFLERNVPWYAGNRDLPTPRYCRVILYESLQDLRGLAPEIEAADLVIVGSYVPDGIAVCRLVQSVARGCTAFYDIDTPVTLSALQEAGAAYIEREQIPAFDLYLSFTGGPVLDRLEREFGARRARALYCAVDPDVYVRDPGAERDVDLGYLGTYSADRQPTLERLLVEPARRWPEGRFVLAGPQYPDGMDVPPNVTRITHLAPAEHRRFYNRQRFTLNVTRRDMIAAGHSPSVRLFEAAACGTPIISDAWPGLEAFFVPDFEILIAREPSDVLAFLRDMPDHDRARLGERGRRRVLGAHTAFHRAIEIEEYVRESTGAPIPVRVGHARPA
ncbi:MAG: glycosyltransferase [Vicinamibacterales bacterium]